MTIFNKLNQWLIAILLATIINYSIIAEDNVNKTDEKNNVVINNNNQIKDNNMQITKETIIESSKNGNIKTIVIDNSGDVDVNKDTNISDIISSVHKVINENENKTEQQNNNQNSNQTSEQKNNQIQSIKLDENLDPNSNIKVVNITTNGSNYIDNKENKDVYIKQNQPIEIENGKVINDGANKIVINDGTKNIYVELRPEIKINCNDCNNNCNKKTNNINNSTSNKKNMSNNSSKKNNINNKNTKKTNNQTKTKQKNKQNSIKKNTNKASNSTEIVNIKPYKTNINDTNKAIPNNNNQEYQAQQPKKDKTINKINQNIYVLNTIIGIDEDDVITEDTLKKVEIDQKNLAQIVGTPITENKANKQYKEEFINKQLISQNNSDVMNDNNIKYGEVAFVDSYLDY